MMKWKIRLCTIAASFLTLVALTEISVASIASWYQPEIPEELK